MFFQITNRAQSAGQGYPLEADATSYLSSIGKFAFSRVRRDGRNPSTGARTSRKYWQRMFYVYGFQPLSTIDGPPIY